METLQAIVNTFGQLTWPGALAMVGCSAAASVTVIFLALIVKVKT